MLYCALATDYDGTLATDGHVDGPTLEALRELKTAGKRLILITGRELPSIREVFQAFPLFDLIVAENGALLFDPATQQERLLAASPPERFIAALRAKKVEPLSVGRSIVATWTPNDALVLDTLRELGLDWQLTFNKGAVMCLPPGVNKASGLAAALEQLKLSAHNVVGVGDAENDRAFLAKCGCAVAVANALETVKDTADVCTKADHGAGVTELINGWLHDPGATCLQARRHNLLLGEGVDGGAQVHLPGDRGAVLIAGSSGVGKSMLTRLLIERMIEGGYQVCIVDPEGDYGNLDSVAHLGDATRSPGADEVMSVLDAPHTSIAVNLLGVDVTDRPVYFRKLLGQLNGLRAGSGRPHWLVLDEAHHLCPRSNGVHDASFPVDMPNTLFVTTHPKNLSLAALGGVRTVIAVGDAGPLIIDEFCRALGMAAPAAIAPHEGTVIYWDRNSAEPPRLVAVGKARQEHQRHTRKYSEGRLGEDKSFYFRGPDAALNLRAFNLATFLQLAQGVDDATWLFHLERGDYTRWFRDAIKDADLAAETEAIQSSSDAAESREAVAEAVKRRYAAANVE
jgi:HAD superfamily hydrolase (TIGR01484 family)